MSLFVDDNAGEGAVFIPRVVDIGIEVLHKSQAQWLVLVVIESEGVDDSLPADELRLWSGFGLALVKCFEIVQELGLADSGQVLVYMLAVEYLNQSYLSNCGPGQCVLHWLQ